ncbi:MAG: hypothetical protein H0U10_05720 [Chloroflexia bacterium]|nr:hypothetical protein [Chloroflexia bacterium]
MTALAATLHDPAGRMLPLLKRHAPALAAYAAVAIAITPETDDRVAAVLRANGGNLLRGGSEVGRGRRDAVAAASRVVDGDVLCVDFDRWLFWIETHPDELLALPARLAARRPRPWYAAVGRSRRAWETHPAAQRACEGPTNRALSLAAGRILDATAGCCWLAPDGVRLVLAASTEASNATDLEWPALVLRHDRRRLGFVRVEGLAFETAAFYPREVKTAGGVTAWIAQTYDRPEVWAARLRLAADSAAALTRVLGPSDSRLGAASPEDRGRGKRR